MKYTFVTLPPYWRLAVHEYLSKMATATPEPSCWNKSLKNLPNLSLRFVDEWAKQEAKVPKKVLIRGYSNFCEIGLLFYGIGLLYLLAHYLTS